MSLCGKLHSQITLENLLDTAGSKLILIIGVIFLTQSEQKKDRGGN